MGDLVLGRDSPALHLYLERAVGGPSTSPWDLSSSCALLAWLVLIVGWLAGLGQDMDCLAFLGLTAALLGRPGLRVARTFTPMQERPFSSTAAACFATAMAYASLVRGSGEAAYSTRNGVAYARRRSTCLGPFFPVLAGMSFASLALASIILKSQTDQLQAKLDSTRHTLASAINQTKVLDKRVHKAEDTLVMEREAHELASNLKRLKAHNDARNPSNAEVDLSNADADTSGTNDSLAIARNKSVDPSIFMSTDDVMEFPMAGMLAPCLANNRDSLPHGKSYPTCAVVGGSPNQGGTGHGAEIDNHTVVFRAGNCRRAFVHAHVRDIGGRTNFCVTFYNTAAEGDTTTKVVIPLKSWRWLIEPDQKIMQQEWKKCRSRLLLTHPSFLLRSDYWLDTWANKMPKVPEASVGVQRDKSAFCDLKCSKPLSFGKACESQCRRLVHLSSGLYSVLLAMELCRKVDVYGFDESTNPSDAYSHLSGAWMEPGRKALKDHPHPFVLERHLLKQWQAAGLLRLRGGKKGFIVPVAPGIPARSNSLASNLGFQNRQRGGPVPNLQRSR